MYSRRSCLCIRCIEFKEGDRGDVMEKMENVPMSWVFHLMKIKLTKRMVFERPSWIRNGKKKLGQ